MRFNNDDYLKAFPREERAASPEKTVVTDEPGSVFDDQDEASSADPGAADPEAAGGDEVENG